MADDHCQVIRDEFKLLDRYNSEQLSNFFLRYKFFSTNDLSQVLSLSSRYIRRLKSRTDPDRIIRTRQKHTPPKNLRVLPNIKLEPGWDCAEWWRHYYQLYGSYILVKITHLSRPTVRKRLRKYNVQIRTKRASPINHPCYNYEWLYKHYVELSWNTARCAKAAGVSPDTIITWLNNFKIQVKTRNAPKIKARNNTAMGEAPCVTIRTN
jgi:hypothetical protein